MINSLKIIISSFLKREAIKRRLAKIEETYKDIKKLEELEDSQKKKVIQVKRISEYWKRGWQSTNTALNYLESIATKQVSFSQHELDLLYKKNFLYEELENSVHSIGNYLSRELKDEQKNHAVALLMKGEQEIQKMEETYIASAKNRLNQLLSAFHEEILIYQSSNWRYVVDPSFRSLIERESDLIAQYKNEINIQADYFREHIKRSLFSFLADADETKRRLDEQEAYQQRVKDRIRKFSATYLRICRAIDYANEIEFDKLEEVFYGELLTFSSIASGAFYAPPIKIITMLRGLEGSDSYLQQTEEEYAYLRELLQHIDPNTPIIEVLQESPFETFAYISPDEKDSSYRNMPVKAYFDWFQQQRHERDSKSHNALLRKQLELCLMLGEPKVIIVHPRDKQGLYHEQIHRVLHLHSEIKTRIIDYIKSNKIENTNAFKSARKMSDTAKGSTGLLGHYDVYEEFVVVALVHNKFKNQEKTFDQIEFPQRIVELLNANIEQDRLIIYQNNRNALFKLEHQKKSYDNHLWNKFPKP